MEALIGLLDPEATAISDGGGRAPAHRFPNEGHKQIARAYVDIVKNAPGLTIREHTVNSLPGLVAELEGLTVTVYAFDIAGDRIQHIWAIRNPDKLRPWTRNDECKPD